MQHKFYQITFGEQSFQLNMFRNIKPLNGSNGFANTYQNTTGEGLKDYTNAITVKTFNYLTCEHTHTFGLSQSN